MNRRFKSLTFSGRNHVVVLSGVFQGEGDAEELHVAVTIPHQQLLSWTDLLAGLVKDLTLDLYSNQILLVWETGTLH